MKGRFLRRRILMGILVFAFLTYVITFLSVHFPIQLVNNFKKLENKIRTIAGINNADHRAPDRLSHLYVYGGIPLAYDYRIKDDRTSVWHIQYENFKLPPPLFITDSSRLLFYKNTENVDFIGFRAPEAVRGEIHVVRRGTYLTSLDCGYKANESQVHVKRNVSGDAWFNKALPMYTPEAWTFQHFIDSALPKIIQSLHLLKDRRVTLLFEKPPRDKIIWELLDALGVSKDQILFVLMPEIGANYLYFTCITPPIHPVLWQSARRLIGVPETLSPDLHKDAFVVFVTRKGCHNCGRLVRNEDDLVKMLIATYGKTAVQVFRGGMNLTEVIDMFGKARIIMGAHGGGLYNINFAPINTTVIEFMPTHPDGRMEASSKTIIWSQANLLGQIYWRMCSKIVPDSKGDMEVDLNELSAILNATDANLHQSRKRRP